MADHVFEIDDSNFETAVLNAEKTGAGGLLGAVVRTLPDGRAGCR